MDNGCIKFNNSEFHKGFYENTNEDICFILFEIKESNSEEIEDYTADVFLHGLCHIFAYALHQKFGYDVIEIENKSVCHWFCISKHNGKEVYIDVRGMTTDYEELLQAFQPGIGSNPQRTIINDFSKHNDEWEEKPLKFANEVISKYYNYYSLN